MGLAGLAGGLGLRGLARAETPTPEHSRHATPTPDVTAATNHAGDHGGMGTVGQVDHAANQFDPHEILTDFDTGVLTEEDGRPVRTWEMYAVDREFEIAPGVHFPGWVYGTPTSAASRRLGHVVGQCPGPTLRCVEGVSPERFLFDPGTIEIPNRFAPNDPGRVQPFVCWNLAGHGSMNMRLGIANSCDVYFYKISGGFDQDGEFVEGLTVDRIDVYGTQFGYGRVQGIELPLEAEGNLPTRAWKRQTQGEPWSTGDDYNLGIGQGFMTATPLQQAQMASVIANGGYLYRPSIIHHMTDADGNVVIVDDNSQIVARVHVDRNGQTIITDAEGNVITDPAFSVQFDAQGNPIFQPEVIDTLAVDRQYIQVVQEGMEMVNNRMSDTEFFTGATYVDWDALEAQIGATAGKTGTAEYCDNIAITRGWCRFEDTVERRILPTHAWYVGYAPVDDPQIAVAVFVFNGGEGSQWAAPVACHVMAAYFHAGQYAEPVAPSADNPEAEAAAEVTELPTVCASTVFNPELPPTEAELAAEEAALLEQIQPTPIPVAP